MQGIQTDVHNLKKGLVRVSWLEEDGVLDVLERSFIQMLLLALRQCQGVAFARHLNRLKHRQGNIATLLEFTSDTFLMFGFFEGYESVSYVFIDNMQINTAGSTSM